MRVRPLRCLLPIPLWILIGCHDSTGPATTLEVDGPSDFTAIVYQSTPEDFYSPAGTHVSQYDVWIGPTGGTGPDAGVLVGSETPVFTRRAGRLDRTTGASIAVGDLIEVWRRDFPIDYGTVEAPPGAPCYWGTQVVIVR